MSSPHDAVIDSPVGRLGLRLAGARLASIAFVTRRVAARPATPAAGPVVARLRAYFEDPGAGFMLPLALTGTAFQLQVWAALRQIPVGATRTYGELARMLGSGPRAVAGACRSNPLPIIVPCHRVVAADGLGGYGGATRGPRVGIKRWLLMHEGVDRP